jgi:hypothetical protein
MITVDGKDEIVTATDHDRRRTRATGRDETVAAIYMVYCILGYTGFRYELRRTYN